MKCSVARENILRWSDGETPDDVLQREVEDHLAQCQPCKRWKEYLKVIQDGPEDMEIPPFELSQRVAEAIQEEEAKSPSRTAPSFRLVIAVALAVLVAFVGIYQFVSQNPPGGNIVEWVQTDGQAYKVIRRDSSASFDPSYLKPSTAPALQSKVSRQLAFLSDSLAIPLRTADESIDWEGLRGALEEQKIRIEAQPEFLAISGKLMEILQTDTRDVEIWVIQTTDSVLLFTLVGEGEW